MVFDPLYRPINSLRPPVWVGVESAKVDVLQFELGVEVTTIRTVVCPVVGLDVEATLATSRDKVVLVQALDVGAHLIVPSGDQLWSAVFGSWQIAYTVGATAGFVGELPSEDGRVVLVSGHNGLDVSLESLLDLRQAVELCPSQRIPTIGELARTNIVVVFSTKVDRVNVHASIIGPVIRECHYQFDPGLACGIDDFVKGRHINRRLAVCPALEDDFSPTSTLSTVLWESFRDVCDILVIEAPGTEDVQASLLCGGQTQLDVRLVLCSELMVIIWKVVGNIRC